MHIQPLSPSIGTLLTGLNFGGIWHSDTAYQPCPPMAIMLDALELPALCGDTLFAHQIRPEFLCRHSWQTSDFAIWDNRCTLHYQVNDYDTHRRLLPRITLKGNQPI